MFDWNEIETYKIAYKNKLRVPKEHCIQNINRMFNNTFGFTPKINNPVFLTEKLQWLKFHYRNPLLIQIQDKLLSKEYFKQKGIDESFYPKTLGTIETVSEVDLNNLPNRFVIKVNHGSGAREVFPVFDKNDLKQLSQENLDKLISMQNSLIIPNRGALSMGEWWYLYVESKLFIEEFLEHDYLEFDDGKSYRGEFRVYCFHGEPKLFFYNHDPDDAIYPKFDNKRCPATYYNKNWKTLDLVKHSPKRKYPKSTLSMIKPSFFDDMYDICRILSEDFPFMRVDLIPTKEGIKINELTPSPSSGVFRYNPYPEEIDLLMGEMLDLNNIKPYTPFKYKK